MKSRKILLLEGMLRLMAVAILKRHRPKIVAITGSVGKTSAKDAVFKVLSSKFYVRENQKNYNNEIGIPLTIIGTESGGKNIVKWFWVFLKWLWILIIPGYPKILVLELGIDRPGDMKYFMSFIHPMVGVVTNVSSSHIEFFDTVEKIAKEKGLLVRSLEKTGFAVLNFDDELVARMQIAAKSNVLSFGLNQDSVVNASNLTYNYHQNGEPDGISFKLNYDGKNIPIRLKNIVSGHYVYAALAAVATGIVFKMNLVEIAQALEDLKSPVGRMNLMKGVNGSYIIDDTYNASPVSTKAALDVLLQLQSKRKIAVLGDMLELGGQSESGHEEVIERVFQSDVDFLLVLGERLESAVKKFAADSVLADKIMTFKNHSEVILALKGMIDQGDFILVKGSQGMRMEKIVEGILAVPSEAESLLCRQSTGWKKRQFSKP